MPVTAGQTRRCGSQRSFTVPAGTTTSIVVVKEPTPDKARRTRRRRRSSVIKQTVKVPDFWNNELTTSSVIVAQRIDPLPAPLTPQQQTERPYALGDDGDRAGLRDQVHEEGRSSRPSC